MQKFVIIGLLATVILIGLLLGGIYFMGVVPRRPELPTIKEASPSSFGQLTREALVALNKLTPWPLERSVTKVVTPGALNQLAAAGLVSSERSLSRAGVIAVTNEERIRGNLPPLAENAKLNEAARLRLEDMFKNQYFAHQSPAGGGVAEAVKTTGYQYIVVGENLALGGFRDDRAVVAAWLKSPGHKANMLARRYADIGVAVGEGNYEGTRARLAVQVFGTPISVCPGPAESLKADIYENKKRIDQLESKLAGLKTEIDQAGPLTAGLSSKIKEYKRLATEFNSLIRVTQAAIVRYNDQVGIFNICADTK